jgi:hypothetical protein
LARKLVDIEVPKSNLEAAIHKIHIGILKKILIHVFIGSKYKYHGSCS